MSAWFLYYTIFSIFDKSIYQHFFHTLHNSLWEYFVLTLLYSEVRESNVKITSSLTSSHVLFPFIFMHAVTFIMTATL
jgi:hypothetical protein